MAKHEKWHRQLAATRPVTWQLIEAVLLDVWPGRTAIVDFGIDSQTHFESLYYPIREGEITPQALDDALGQGEKLTALVRGANSNPHKDVEFHTSWDVLLDRSSKPIAPIDRVPSPAEIANERRPPPSDHDHDREHDRDRDF